MPSYAKPASRHRMIVAVWSFALFAAMTLIATPTRADDPVKEAAKDGAKEPVPAAPTITFLQGDVGRKAFLDDSVQPYFQYLQPLEMHAKTGRAIEAQGKARQRAELRKRYAAAVKDFTQEERAVVKKVVDRIEPLLAKQYPLLTAKAMPWQFIKIDDTAEFGLPHTRGYAIVLPQRTLARLIDLDKNPRGGFNIFMALGGLLLHERLHVAQRYHAKRFDDLYINVWGFRHVDDIKPNERLESLQIVNPDATDLRWVFPIETDDGRQWIWPRVLLTEEKDPALSSMASAAVMLDRKGGAFEVRVTDAGEPDWRPLRKLTAYTKHFSNVRSVFHPNEISASLFSRIVVFDHLLPPGMVPAHRRASLERSYAPLRTWFEKNLSVKLKAK